MMLRDVPEMERPRERMIQQGAKYLSNAELIALLLRTGSSGESVMSLAQRVLAQTDGLKELARITLPELIEIKGIGPAKAIQLLAGMELGRRICRALPNERFTIRSPHDVAEYVMDEMRYLEQEHFVALYLNTKNQIIQKKCLFIGGLNTSVVHPRELFREAIRCSSAAIICVHNHPSGNPAPSQEDIDVTVRLVEVGRLIGIEILDHVIIGDQVYCSLQEKGLLSNQESAMDLL